MDLVGLAIQIIVGIVVVAPCLWLSGRALVGKQKAKFTDAIWIVTLGVVTAVVVGSLVPIGSVVGGLAGVLIMCVIWLALVKHFFDCGWLKALAIAIIAVIIFVIIGVVLAIVGFGWIWTF
jgi:hypothetical protein